MTVEIISWSISTKVWDKAGIKLRTPWAAVRQASVARHLSDCAMPPGKWSQGRGQFEAQGLYWQDLCRGPLDIAIYMYQIYKMWASLFQRRFFKVFPYYKPMEAICCHSDQSSNSISPKTWYSLSPNQGYSWQELCREPKILVTVEIISNSPCKSFLESSWLGGVCLL